MKWPPKSDAEFAAWLKYQKTELIALPLVPKKVKVGDEIIDIPQELREEIAVSDNVLKEIALRIELFLCSEHQSKFLAAGSVFSFCE